MSEYKFSEEEKELQQKLRRLYEESKQKDDKFWKDEYPTITREEKVKVWVAIIHTGMRSQGDVTGDEYTQFTPAWYQSAKSTEPGFDDIFKDVVKRLGREFRWDEYKKRISG